MPTCDLKKVALQLWFILCNFIEIALRHGCSPVNLLHIFRTSFPKKISGGLLLTMRIIGSKLLRDKPKPLLKKKPYPNIFYSPETQFKKTFKILTVLPCHKNSFKTIEDCYVNVSMHLENNRLEVPE